MASIDRAWTPPAASAQAGVFSVRQARAAGLTRHQVAHRLRTGVWTRVAGSALVRTGVDVGPVELVQAAALCWPDAVVCLGTAARLHHLPVPDDGALHVNVPTPRARRGVLRPHEYELDDADVVPFGLGRVTSRDRTIVDCLGRLPADQSASLLAWVLSRRLTTAETVSSWVAAHPGAWGNARRRVVAQQLAGRVASPAELLLHNLLRAAGVRGWAANASLRDEIGVAASVDVWFADVRLVVEVDGHAFHGADRFQQDRSRQNLLVAAGCTVLRYTWDDLTRRPDMVVAQIRDNLARLRSAARP